jgi:hypothetical protein
LGELAPKDVRQVTTRLRDDGYYVFEQKLPAEFVASLMQTALTRTCQIRPRDEETSSTSPVTGVYDRTTPRGIIYDIDPDDLVNDADVQALMADASVLSVAQAYLGSSPVLDTVNMWWTTAASSRADSNAAQLYHFDMDHVRWLKFFVYLTDVGPDNGPHCFVAGSHSTGGIPRDFLSRGYVRLTDEEVAQAYPADRLVTITGPAGTILAVDTRGLHKGAPVRTADRLMFEMEFSNSLFGANPVKQARLRTIHDARLAELVRAHPRIYRRWLESRA